MDSEYTCHSLPLAAWLAIRGHSYKIQIDVNDETRAVFVFERDNMGQLDRDIVDFQSDGGSVAPRVFKGVEIKLRDQMFVVLREGGQHR